MNDIIEGYVIENHPVKLSQSTQDALKRLEESCSTPKQNSQPSNAA